MELLLFGGVLLALSCLVPALLATDRVEANVKQLRATWLPNSYESSTEESMYAALSGLKEKGVQTVYVDVWNQGTVFFRSPTMLGLVGQAGVGDDHLQWALNAGNKLGIAIYAWFEYGLICAYDKVNNDFARVASQNGWVLGQYPKNGFIWLDPASSHVLNFTLGILKDAIEGYSSSGLKGVQLDDHFSSPVDLLRKPEDMDKAMHFISTGINGLRQQTILSLAPTIASQALASYNVDWDSWGVSNYYDELVPQLYRTSFSSFQAVVNTTLRSLSPITLNKWLGTVGSGCGVRVEGSGASTAWEEVRQMVEFANNTHLGVSVWFAAGILDLYPSQFAALWGV